MITQTGRRVKTSFICTFLNEEKTIEEFLKSLARQTLLPDEIILVDGGSSDRTIELVESFQTINNYLPIRLLRKEGNRSIGRNFAINKSRNSLIAISDSGCILDKNWLREITKPFKQKGVDVVAGYYSSKTKTIFQKALIPYVLVMADRIDGRNFLPATRSMALRKKIWKSVGKFPERYSHNEDFVFAKRLKSMGANIVFAKKARVYWIPRNNPNEAFRMFYRFAYGDGEAGIYRPKVFFLFVRYLIAFALLLGGIMLSKIYLVLLVFLFLLYVLWSIFKNYKYVNDKEALFLLPLLQLTSDAAVLSGTMAGSIKRLMNS